MLTKKILTITYAQAADRIGVSERQIRRLVSRGVFGKSQAGKKACVFSDEIDAYIEGLAKGNGESAVRAYRVKQGRIKR